jgi:hypothetical protein
MKGIQEETCVKFVPRTTEADYIEIRKAADLGCGAMVGLRPGQGRPMAVNYRVPECLQTTGVIQHELLHVLGLFHEQSRPDRDEHVTILWDNIIPGTGLTCLLGSRVCPTDITNPPMVLSLLTMMVMSHITQKLKVGSEMW